MRELLLLLLSTFSFVFVASELGPCLELTQHVVKEARLGTKWALNMLDATTKIPDGILYGHLTHYGNFDQCLNVNHVDAELGDIKGRHCNVRMNSLLFGVCVPTLCEPEDVAPLLHDYLGPLLGVTINASAVSPTRCSTNENSEPLGAGIIVFFIFVALLVTMSVTCMVLDHRSTTSSLVLAFSLRNSYRRVISTKKEPGSLGCLHGLRVGSMLWVLIGHRYAQQSSGAISNLIYISDYRLKIQAQTIGNAQMAVDSFFLLSGLLMCYSFMRSTQGNVKFDLFKFYIYRYLRIVIPMGFVILIYATALPYIGSGPDWKIYTLGDAEACQTSWWTNTLFINNYYFPDDRMCLGQTWYLAVDMQLAWLSPLLLLPLRHSPRAGRQLGALLIAVSCAVPFAVTYVCGFPMSLISGPANFQMTEGCSFGAQIYNATQCRATPYICGIMLGYFLHETRSKKIKFSKWLVTAGWLICSAVCLTVVYSLTIGYQEDYVYNRLGSSFYSGFHKLAWSLGLSWIIFACITGHGGPIDKILSWSGLLPFSRLTFTAYLVHMILINGMAGSQRVARHFNDVEATRSFLGDIVPVFAMGLMVHLLVEAPLFALLKILFQSRGKRDTKINKSTLPVAASNEELKSP